MKSETMTHDIPKQTRGQKQNCLR